MKSQSINLRLVRENEMLTCASAKSDLDVLASAYPSAAKATLNCCIRSSSSP